MPSSASAASVSVTADGKAVTVSQVSERTVGTDAARSVWLTLSSTVRTGQVVRVTYADPTTGNDANAIQDGAGNDAASFRLGPASEDRFVVRNDSDVAASAPGAPTGLTATTNGQAQIDLAWSAPSDNGGAPVTGYRIESCESSCTTESSWYEFVANTGSTATSWSETGLDPETTRHYRVSAIISAGTGDASASESATTAQDTQVPTPSTSTAETRSS